VLRSHLPSIEIVIAADTDAVDSAETTARAVGGRVVVPAFPVGVTGTDFNDLVQAIGAPDTAKQLLEDTGPDIWSDLEPLPSTLPPVPPFPPELLPDGLTKWLTDIADRMQCPLDFPAIAAMTCLGAVVGRQIAIRPKKYDSWSVVPNLWGMVIGRPGVMKSAAIGYPLQPLELIEAGARSQFDEELQEYKIQLAEAKVSRKEAESELQRQAKKRIKDSGTVAKC
jgi:putative DNA primase/helicase